MGLIPICRILLLSCDRPRILLDPIDRCRTKMQAYRPLGVSLGVLINSQDR